MSYLHTLKNMSKIKFVHGQRDPRFTRQPDGSMPKCCSRTERATERRYRLVRAPAENEAWEMRDGDANRFYGKGVLNAVANINGPLERRPSWDSMLATSAPSMIP